MPKKRPPSTPKRDFSQVNPTRSTFLEPFRCNFETLLCAADDRHLALMECQDARTGEKVPCVVAIHEENGEYVITPLASMLVGNAYEYLQPPKPEGGFHPVEKVG